MIKEVPCAKCDKTVCKIETVKDGDHHLVLVSGFSGEAQHGVEKDIYNMLERMLKIENWRSSHRLNREFVLGYCIKCDKTYCSDHWLIMPIYDEGFFDYLEGTCPKGHTQIIED